MKSGSGARSRESRGTLAVPPTRTAAPRSDPAPPLATPGVALGTNPGSGALSGTTTVAPVAGTATFADLSIDAVGNGYALEATGGGLPAATSAT